MNKKILITISFFALSLVASAAKESKEKLPPAQVLVRDLKKTELFDPMAYPAKIVSKTNNTVLSEADGAVKKIHVGLGQKVKAGAPLVTIKNLDPVYEYKPVTVRSSVSGVVGSLDVSVGTQVLRGQKLLIITDPAHVMAIVEIPSQDMGTIRSGLVGSLKIPSNGEEIPVTVVGISPMIDPTTGTVTAELSLSKPLSPGMLAQVHFKSNTRQGISIPDSAIFFKGKDPKVRILTAENKSQEVPVTLGKKSRGNVEVLSGLEDGQKLIERSSRFISEGEVVEIQKE